MAKHRRTIESRPPSAGVGGGKRRGGVHGWGKLARAIELHAVYAGSTGIIVGEVAAYLRGVRLDARSPDAPADHAVLDVLTAVRWALDAKSPELMRLQRLAHRILKANAPEALEWNRATYRTPADLGRALVAELTKYRADLDAGLAHDARAFAEQIARWLVAANERVQILDAPTVETIRDALIADRKLRDIDSRMKLDQLGARVLRAAGVPSKRAWNAINAADGMKQTRKRRGDQTPTKLPR